MPHESGARMQISCVSPRQGLRTKIRGYPPALPT
ncbi:hypothetical protein HEP75_01354 [Xanthomonas sp. SI]|nr:hypothetical protein HEP75_01354 [Xanthomonas sp. SI]